MSPIETPEAKKRKKTYYEKIKERLQNDFDRRLRGLSFDIADLIEIYSKEHERGKTNTDRAAGFFKLEATKNIQERCINHFPQFEKLGRYRKIKGD